MINPLATTILTKEESDILGLIDRIETQITPPPIQDIIDVDSPAVPKQLAPRRTKRLQRCRNAINQWRRATWLENYINCAWGPNILVPDAIVTKLAARSHILTVEDIKKEIPEWELVDDHGPAVLDVIQKTDEVWKQDRAIEIEAKKAMRKQRSLENKENRDKER